MAKKVSNNTINNAQTDWGRDESNNGWPYSGQSIQEYIRRRLGQIENPNSGLERKYGAIYFDSTSNTVYFFKDTEAKTSWQNDPTQEGLILDSFVINVNSSLLYRIAITNNNSSTDIQISSNATSLNLSLDFDIQVSTLGSDVWTSTGQAAYIELYTIDSGNTRTQIELPNNLYFSGQTFIYNIAPYLSIGTTRVEVRFISEQNSSTFNSIIYSITVSEMYIEEFSNNWHKAIVEPNTDYQLGGFRIIGSMYKTLHIELYSLNELKASFETDIGIVSYVDSPYYFTKDNGFDLSSRNLPTGIYTVKAYLTSGNLSSLPVIYSIMYIREEDKFTAHLVCINNVAEFVYNYATSKICDYAIYNEGQSTGNPHIKLDFVVGTTPTTMYDNTPTGIETGVPHSYSYTVEWLTEETINLFASLVISLGEQGSSYGEQQAMVRIDNSATYPAEAGMDFYLSSTTRTNGDANKLNIINEATYPATEIEGYWERMSWVDGIDGWTFDDNHRKCLLIPARSSVSIPYRVFTGENISFELCFKIKNVSDYSENAITIATNPTTENFQGIIIKPTNLIIHSAADAIVGSSKDIERGTNFEDEKVVHLLVTISGNYGGNNEKNLVTGYINGSIGFQFEYTTGTAWDHIAPIIIGSQTADICLYFIRVYRKVLGKSAVERNYINSLDTLNARKELHDKFYSIVKENTHEIIYETVSKSNKNYFVVEMLDDLTIPSRANGWSKETTGKSNFEMHFGEHPLWDFKLYNVETGGQGTTSMDYYRWNLRFRIDKSNDDKKIPVAYYDAPTVKVDGSKEYHEQDSHAAKVVYFDGGANNTVQNHPAVKRITAKINFASSMQSHKIGATRAYNDIRNALGITNAAQRYAVADENNILPKPTVAVYQYPAYGFSKKVSPQGVASYEYIGLFTIGPDKGDKPTFGYDINDDIKETLITLEGTDHSRRMAKFNYPWNQNVQYRSSNECLNIIINENSFDNAWEVGNCYDLDTDKLAHQDAVQQKLIEEFKPAYDSVYNNSTLIFPIPLNVYGATAEQTLAAINADVSTFQETIYNNRFSYADLEFWIEGEYVLYYYDIVTKQYVAGVNLITDLNQGNPEGSTLEEKNEWFKQRRRERFKSIAENYWDIQDAIYHFLFIVIFGATDNFAKNTYPYKMGNGKWQWRQDDLDTIFDIDNTGGQTKPYYIEYEDGSRGTTYFAGSNSVFWNLLYETYWNNYGVEMGIESLGGEFIRKMANLGTGSNTLEGCINFIKSRFWNNAQNYFNEAAYNVDSVFKYEAAWLSSGQSVDPLKQSLGNHYSAEMLWVTRRMIYMMSLFKVGLFGSYADKTLGSIEFRPRRVGSITVTPVYELYPALTPGAGSPTTTARTSAGQSYTFTGLDADGNTTYYIKNSDLLSSIGDLKNLTLADSYIQKLTIDSAKLRSFKIGDAVASNVTTNVPALEFSRTACLETLDARNASSISGTLDLTPCTRLYDVKLGGTSLTQVNLPSGSKIETLELPDTTTTIIFKNLKYLTNLTLPSDVTNIRGIQVENCTYQDGFSMLRNLYNTDNTALQYIRVIWSEPIDATVYDLSMLANIATNKNKDNETVANEYGGYDNSGSTTRVPVIQGTLQLSTGIYTDDLENIGVQESTIEDYGDQGLKRAKTESFGTLYIIYDPNRIYISFADSDVEDICMAQSGWSSDGIGITMNDATRPTSLGTVFRGNTNITSFDELEYFTNIKVLGSGTIHTNQGPFEGCTNLTSVNLKNVTNVSSGAFTNCSSLSNLGNTNSVERIGRSAFKGTAITDVNFPNLEAFYDGGHAQFQSCPNLKTVTSLGKITTLPGAGSNSIGMFQNVTSLKSVVLPNTLTNIGYLTFVGCTGLETINFPSSVASIGESAFSGCSAMEGDLNLTGLTSIGAYAFKGCASLTSIQSLGNLVTIPNGNYSTNIGTFSQCSSITSVVLPSTLTSVGDSAFNQCTSLETLDFSESGSFCSVGARAFYLDAALTTITNISRISSIGSNAFQSTDSLAIALSLPNLTSISSAAFRFSGITSIVDLGSITTIPNGGMYDGVFQGCPNLTTAKLPQPLTLLGQHAFADCPNLESIDFSGAACTIGANSMANCSKLTTWTNYQNVVQIDNFMPYPRPNNVFELELTRTSFPNLTVLGGAAFYTKRKLTGEVYLPSLTSIGGSQAFEDTRITSITSLGTITTIPGATFRSCSALTSIVFPSTLTTIGDAAFAFCTALAIDVNIPSLTNISSSSSFEGSGIVRVSNLGTITSIGVDGTNNNGGAFFNCTSLAEVILPNTLEDIKKATFSGCTALTSISLPSALKYIRLYAFSGCTNLSTLTLQTDSNSHASLEGIGAYCFQSTGLTAIDFRAATGNENPLTIGNDAFRYCTELKSVKLPSDTVFSGGFVFANGNDGAYTAAVESTLDFNLDLSNSTMTSIQACTFYRSYLQSITGMSSTITSIAAPNSDRGAFEGSPYLTSVALSSGLTSIGERAFMNCGKLTAVTYNGEGSVSVGQDAFYHCTSLTSLGGLKISYMGRTTFSGCSFTSLDLSDSTFTAVGGPTGSQQGYGSFYQCTELVSVVLPSTCTEILSTGFSGCSKLTTINLGNIQYIRSYGFNGCDLTGEFNLTSMIILSQYSFAGCRHMTKVVCPNITDTYTTVYGQGSAPFYQCTSLAYIDFGASTANIASYTFAQCTGLKTFICRATTPPVAGSSIFSGVPTSTLKIYVPDASVDAYKAAEGWSTYSSCIVGLSELPS